MSKKQYASICRITSLLLCGVLCSLTACQNASNENSGNETTSSQTSTVTETTVEEEKPSFEKCDYNGEVFNIYSPGWGLYTNYFFADEQTGDAMNDAIYERQMLVEDYLGIDITYFIDEDEYQVLKNLQQTVMSGDDTYQLMLTHCMQDVSAMLTNGLLYDWNNFEYCDFEKDYWNQNCNENLSVNGHQYYAISDFMLPDPNCILFNKDIIENYSLENPYDLVRSGDWTFDKMVEMCAEVTTDLDGNSVYDINDQYGMGSPNDWFWNSFIFSSGINLVSRDDSGNYKLTIGDERMYTLVEKVDNLVNKTNFAYLYDFQIPEEEKLLISSGRTLFQIESFNRLHLYRDTDVDFGILPYPKLDASQDGYHVNDWSGLMLVPKTVGNPEMVGKACELLAFYSDSTTIPAYYDLVLGAKLSRDDDSREMMEIIYDNIVFDPGMNYFGFNPNMTQLFYTLHYMVIKQESADYASWYAQYGPPAEEEIQKFLDDVAKLDQ